MKRIILAILLSVISLVSNAATGVFDMYDSGGTLFHSDPAVVASIVYPGTGSTIASPTTIFGTPWTAHDITTYQQGTYIIDTVQGGTYTFTVGVGQIGLHMLFDWGVNFDVDVVNVWDVTSAAGVVSYSSTDWDGDGIPGSGMIDGPFPEMNVNFNLEGSDLPVVANVPAITLLGGSEATVQTGSTYVDAGATASDIEDGDLTASIVITNPVNTSVPGTYSVSYSVTDSDSNTTTASRTVNVITGTFPTITFNGNSPVTVYTDTIYNDAGAIASDAEDGDLTSSIVTTNAVNTSIAGSYTVNYSVTDSAGNTTTETRTVNVITGEVPVISMSGSSPVTLAVGASYVDSGATASDTEDGDLTGSIATTNSVNTAVAGTYSVTYNVTDSNGNTAAAVTRTVHVIDPNVVTGVFDMYDSSGALIGSDSAITASIVYPGAGSSIQSPTPFFGSPWTMHDITTYQNGTYTIDTIEGGTYTFTVGTGQIGVHMLFDWSANTDIDVVNVWDVASSGGVVYYTSTDWDGDGVLGAGMLDGPFPGFNANFDLSGGVLPVASNAPEITLLGSSILTVQTGSAYVDAGATASDVDDGDLTASIVTTNLVDTSTAGTYTVSYSVTDADSNTTIAMRSVNVVTGTFPIITLNGSSPVTVYRADAYVDAGATANDAEDGNLTGSIVTTNAVNTSIAGAYTVNYSVTDADSNTSTITRTVNVITGEIPVITMSGSTTVMLAMGEVYVDAGATASDAEDGELTASIVVTNLVDTSVAGSYNVIYNVTDSNGNIAKEVERTVYVIDPDAVSGVLTVLDPVGGVTTTDPTVSASIVFPGAGSTISSPTPFFGLLWTIHDVVTYQAGTYTVDTVEGGAYTFTVGANQIGAHILIDWGLNKNMDVVNVWDVTTDAGITYYTSTDWDEDGIAGAGLIEGPFPGFNVNFDLTGGNLPVIPQGNTPPYVSLNGSTYMTVYKDDVFVDTGVTATDVEDGDITSSVAVSGVVDTAVPGNYKLIYTAMDSSAYSVSLFRYVSVVEADGDSDGFEYLNDNCIDASNADQRDTDGDGYGNACDSDLNDDGVVNSLDIGLFKQTMFTVDQDADINGDGIVNSIDIALFKQMYLQQPGPSGTL